MKRSILLSIFTFFLIITMLKTIICQEHNQFFWINNQNSNFDNYVCEDLDKDCIWFCLRWTNYYANPENSKIHIRTTPTGPLPWKLNSLDQEKSAAEAALNAWNSIVKNSNQTPFVEDNESGNDYVVRIVNDDDNQKFGGGASLVEFAIDEEPENLTNLTYTFMYYNWNWYFNNITKDEERTTIFINSSMEFTRNFPFVWGEPAPGTQEIDIQQVITHELGHVLGLGENTISGSIMKSSGIFTRYIDNPVRMAFGALYGVDIVSGELNK